MRWRRVVAMARKEVIQIYRDVRSLIIVLVMPVVLTFLFGYGVSLDLKRVPLAVYDREGSPESQDLLHRFRASEYFEIVLAADNYEEILRAIDRGEVRMAVVLPHDFSRQLRDGGRASVQVIVDATDDNTANVVSGYAESVLSSFRQQVQLDWLARQGRARVELPLRVEPRTWFNEELESDLFVVPGVVAIVMAVIGTFLTALTIAREWERGTMEQLIATPVTPLEILVGKLAPYFMIGLLDTAVCVAIAVFWFRIPFRGSVLALLLAAALFLMVVLSIGYVMSVVAKNQLAASQAALVSTFLPVFLLSGFLFAIEQMPLVLQQITRIIPARYFVSLLKKIFLKGSPMELLRADLIPLALFALLLTLLATRAFRKRLV
ncbi:MAG: ABC transporter permease [Acidobacteriia bacterium]|jgi:ABC-2 type transport system permease protein|nr:ABC transporter permease [Terriglobia bacterium]